MAKKSAKAVEPTSDDDELDEELPKAQVVERDVPEVEDPWRRPKIAGFMFLLLCGWAFVLGTNKFHVTAPVVFASLAYTALLTAILNLWRTGASAAGPDSIDSEWGRPLGKRGELEKEKKTLLKGIKEAEFDAATKKLSQADADFLIKEYRARAIEVIKEIDRLEAGAALSPKEQIAREVKARVELEKVAKTKKSKAEPEPEPAPEPKSAEPEPKAKKADADANAEKIAAAEAKVAAARAAAEAAEAKAAAARAEAEAAEAKAEVAKAEAEKSAGESV